MAVSSSQARYELSARLHGRREEIEQIALVRISAIADPAEVTDPAYLEGLRVTVSAALDYGLAVVDSGSERAAPAPPVLLAQARLAARSGVSLDTVLRRYFAGYTLLGDFLIEESQSVSALDGSTLKHLLRTQATLFDRLLAAVTGEYSREASEPDTSEQRRAERVRRLLDGELLDTTELAYDFDGIHVGILSTGPDAPRALLDLAAALDRRLLLIRPDKRTVWAWLGGEEQLARGDLGSYLSASWPSQAPLVLGQPSWGLAGWRLSHRQAAAALPVALRSKQRLVLYSDVALLATALQDRVLSDSLRQLYLAPLEAERDGGEAARQTLRAYFASGRNVSSAAAALGISRRTVTSRLRVIEDRLGREIDAAGLEVALDLDGLADAGPRNLRKPRSTLAR